MASRPAKRARATSNSDTSQSVISPARVAKLSESIDFLDEDTIKDYLLLAAQESPKIASLIESAATAIKDAEAAEVIDFDSKSKSVWRTLNCEYSRLRQSAQFERSGDACHDVERSIQYIGDNCPAHASYGTKRSALQTLRKIGKIICLTGETMGRQARQHFHADRTLEKTMKGILESMSVEDRASMISERDGDTTYIEKLKELHELGSGYALFEDLDEVIDLLEGTT